MRVLPDDVVALARVGKSEPDFIFYQRNGDNISSFGVIELKRPDSRILRRRVRKNIVQLSGNADLAIKQAEQYAQSVFVPEKVLFIGGGKYVFVIMGLTDEIQGLSKQERLDLVPPNCQILPYDEVLRCFEASLPSSLVMLVPVLPTDPSVAPPHPSKKAADHPPGSIVATKDYFQIIDRDGKSIYLSRDRWLEHILRFHSELNTWFAQPIVEIARALSRPYRVRLELGRRQAYEGPIIQAVTPVGRVRVRLIVIVDDTRIVTVFPYFKFRQTKR